VKHVDRFHATFDRLLAPDAIDRLLLHAELLERWNRVVRLVGEDRPEDWVRRHYLESVVAQRLWRPGTSDPSGEPSLLDIGSGAGFPGLVLAALHPERPVTLVESRERKAAFLAEAARELGLPRVRVVRDHFRAASAQQLAGAVECATVRALRLPEAAFLALLQALPDHGRLVLWTGMEPGTVLAKNCIVEEEIDLPGSRHRRVVSLRTRRRG